MNEKRKKNILVVCHDAGGAEIISAYVKKNLNKFNFVCFVLGPAVKIFERKGLKSFLLRSVKTPAEIIAGIKDLAMVLTGTSWASAIELDFIRAAKEKGVKTAAYLEHWLNYRERFGYPRPDWKNNLPEEIWVGDQSAFELAKNNFAQKAKLRLVPNLYFEEIKKQYKKLTLKKNQTGNILFLGEPISGPVNSFGDQSKIKYDELAIFDQLLEYLGRNNFKKSVIIRLHPSEKWNKYDGLAKKYKNKIKIIKSKNKNILNDLAQVDLVIGMRSTALAISVLCGKKAVSFLPDKEMKLIVPFKEIVRINRIEQLKKI